MRNPPRFWQDFESSATGEIDLSDWIAVLPLGAHEQHGPHLPFETDTIIADGISRNLSTALGEAEKITFLPVEPIGYSPEHLDYPGSKSLGFNEAIERWIGIGKKLHGLGCRKLLLLNAHGGNSPLMTIVATELRVRFSMLVVATSWTRFGTPQGLIDGGEIKYGIHGGDIETSVMLVFDANKVDMKSAENFASFQEKLAAKNQYLRAYGKQAFGWKMQDLNPSGVVGNAANATIEKGEKLIAHSVDGLEQLLVEIQAFDLADLKGKDAINFVQENDK